mmetsp:Transcript_10374/g.21449  ORF Transcript_10374/g.21449 Transcript_10374/m.21449 type:complete len:157 (+) Transcript_10374:705-1175(+)
MDAIAASARRTLSQFRSLELGAMAWALARLQGLQLAWALLERADGDGRRVDPTGLGAIWAWSEDRRWSRRALGNEIRLLLHAARGRGEGRAAAFTYAAVLRAAEAGDPARALFLLSKATRAGQGVSLTEGSLAERIQRSCGGGGPFHGHFRLTAGQ